MQSRKKIKLNLLLGIVSQLVTIVLGILLPRLVLKSYGSEVNGLLSSVTQIYSYIAIVEAGVGGATIQALYRTLSRQDREATNAVLAATNKYYHKSGIIYLLAILIFSTIYPLLIASEVPTVTVVLIIIFNGIGNVVNYFFQGKYLLLFEAEGKNYIKAFLNMVVNVLKNLAKIVLIAQGFDVVFVQAVAMCISLIQMFYVAFYIKRHYSWLDLTVTPDYASISQNKNVLVHELSGLIFYNTDSLILTVACGLKTVSVYSIYTLVFSMISTALSTLTSSVSFVLGQTFNSNKSKYLQLLDLFETYYLALVFSLYTIANIFILPFIELYTAGIGDVNYIDAYLPLTFIASYLLLCGRKSSNLTIDFAGHFKKTQGRSILESVINLSVSIICVSKFGIYGVLFGTIVALLYRSNDMILYSNKKILKRSSWPTYRRWICNLVLFVIVNSIAARAFANIDLSTYARIFLWAAISCLIIIPLFLIAPLLFERKVATQFFQILKSYIMKRGRDISLN